ncbi:MAG TPA: glycosyltransferase, partial [Fibrobacteraceae bacterium]|nr:glycosyltransferase [Fibrobacteraceae bacterium]
MISAIICSRNSVACEWARRNLMRTVGSSEFEFIRIDNSSGQMGICAAYNQGIKRSHGDILIFLHEDVFHLEIGWGARLVQKFHQQANLGLVGVA